MTEYAFDRGYFEGAGYGYPGLYTDFIVHYRTVEIIMKRKPESVIEFGGARGYIVKKLVDRGIKSINMEGSKYCYDTRATDSFHLQDMTKFPYPFGNKQFDLAFSVSVLEYIPEAHIDNVIREMARVSKRGLHGIAFVSGPNDMDKTHILIRPQEWWVEKFAEIAPGYPMEILSNSECTNTPIQLPPPDGLVKLNIGSFINMFHYGWMNIDILDLSEFARANGYAFFKHDVRSGLPFRPGVVDIIYTSHFLEHLTRDEGKAFLIECARILKPNGYIRIAVPDAHKLIGKYKSGAIREYKDSNIGVENAHDDAQALWEILVANHKTIYDYSALYDLMYRCGFTAIAGSDFNGSGSPAIKKQVIDTYPEVSLYVEARSKE